MAGKTRVNSRDIKNESVKKEDLNVSQPGQAVITKVIAGPGITIVSSTGVDPGTGEVTLQAIGGGGGGVPNIEGGAADTIYTPDQCFDGGDASGN